MLVGMMASGVTAQGLNGIDAKFNISGNREAIFYNEFSKRATAAGLNSTQIAEAYEAMKAGDYVKMASYFDTSSPENGAVFWSGNKEGAAAYANGIGGTIMEQTSGGQVFDGWKNLQKMYPEWGTGTALDQKPIWEALSSQYANEASGNVSYVHPEGYYGNVWLNIEYPVLERMMDEGIVINIEEVIIDGK